MRTHNKLLLIMCFFRHELQISQSPGHPCSPRSPPLPVHHPPPAGRPYCHDTHLHHLLPVCSSASGQIQIQTLPLFLPEIGYCLLKCIQPLSFIQVVILLFVASLMVQWLWRRGLDPDNFSIPYLTALGDLLGTGFLALSFRLILMGSSAGTGV